MCTKIIPYQMWRTRQSVGLSASCLPVAEDRRGEPIHGHLDEPLDPRVLQDVRLRRLGLEHHVECKRLQLAVLALLLVDLQ